MKKLALVLLSFCANAVACDVTLSSGASRATIDTALASNTTVCLSAGSYSLGSTTLTIPANKTLAGASMATTTLSSSATRAIGLSSGSTAHDFALAGGGGSTNEFGVLTYGTTGATLYSVDIQGFLISLGVVNSTGTGVYNVYGSNNGDSGNNLADPNVYISNSDQTYLYYGYFEGDGTHPFNDGEIACYDSEDLHIEGTQEAYSGTSAVYLVNCDDAVIEDMAIWNAGGFGVDIVGDSDNVVVQNNTIQDIWYAGGYVDNTNSTVSFYNNTFTSNNDSGDSRFCTGIELATSSPVPTNSGNTVSSGTLFCP